MRIEHVALYVKDKYRKKIQSSHSMFFTRLQRTESEIRSGQGNNREKDNNRKREETVDHERLEINVGHGDYCDLRLFVNC